MIFEVDCVNRRISNKFNEITEKLSDDVPEHLFYLKHLFLCFTQRSVCDQLVEECTLMCSEMMQIAINSLSSLSSSEIFNHLKPRLLETLMFSVEHVLKNYVKNFRALFNSCCMTKLDEKTFLQPFIDVLVKEQSEIFEKSLLLACKISTMEKQFIPE